MCLIFQGHSHIANCIINQYFVGNSRAAVFHFSKFYVKPLLKWSFSYFSQCNHHFDKYKDHDAAGQLRGKIWGNFQFEKIVSKKFEKILSFIYFLNITVIGILS